MNEVRKSVISHIEANKHDLEAKIATIGIDAFIDKIQNVVQSKSSKNEYVFLVTLLSLDLI